MKEITEYHATVARLQNLIQSNPSSVPSVTLEIFCKWIQTHCDFLEKEQQPFHASQNQVPQTLNAVSYNFLSNKISQLLSKYYEFDGIQYHRNSATLSDAACTAIYCNYYLRPRNIVWVDFGFNVGREFGGKHPAIILKNLNNEVLIVAPVSTNKNNSHTESGTVITFTASDMYNMPSIRERFTDITRITPVSVHRLDTNSKIGSLKKQKYQELLQKIRVYY